MTKTERISCLYMLETGDSCVDDLVLESGGKGILKTIMEQIQKLIESIKNFFKKEKAAKMNMNDIIAVPKEEYEGIKKSLKLMAKILAISGIITGAGVLILHVRDSYKNIQTAKMHMEVARVKRSEVKESLDQAEDMLRQMNERVKKIHEMNGNDPAVDTVVKNMMRDAKKRKRNSEKSFKKMDEAYTGYVNLLAACTRGFRICISCLIGYLLLAPVGAVLIAKA